MQPPDKPHNFGIYASAVGKTSRVARAVEAREDEVQLSPVRERYVPIALLTAGVVALIVLCLSLMGGVVTGLVGAAVILVLEAVVFVPVLIAALLLAAKWFDLGLGSLPSLALKIAAVTLGAGGPADVLYLYMMLNGDSSIWLIAAGYAVYMILCGVPLAWLLEIGVAETATVILMFYVPKIAAVLTLAALQPHLFP